MQHKPFQPINFGYTDHLKLFKISITLLQLKSMLMCIGR